MKLPKSVTNVIVLTVCAAPFILFGSMFTGLIYNSGLTRLLLQVSILTAVITGMVIAARRSKDCYVPRHTSPVVEGRGVKSSCVKPTHSNDIDECDGYPAGRPSSGLRYSGLRYSGLRYSGNWWWRSK